MSNKDIYAKTYTDAFIECYPEIPAERSKILIEKAISAALQNIDGVLIEGKAFILTSKKLGIKHTKTAIKTFLSA